MSWAGAGYRLEPGIGLGPARLGQSTAAEVRSTFGPPTDELDEEGVHLLGYGSAAESLALFGFIDDRLVFVEVGPAGDVSPLDGIAPGRTRAEVAAIGGDAIEWSDFLGAWWDRGLGVVVVDGVVCSVAAFPVPTERVAADFSLVGVGPLVLGQSRREEVFAYLGQPQGRKGGAIHIEGSHWAWSRWNRPSTAAFERGVLVELMIDSPRFTPYGVGVGAPKAELARISAIPNSEGTTWTHVLRHCTWSVDATTERVARVEIRRSREWNETFDLVPPHNDSGALTWDELARSLAARNYFHHGEAALAARYGRRASPMLLQDPRLRRLVPMPLSELAASGAAPFLGRVDDLLGSPGLTADLARDLASDGASPHTPAHLASLVLARLNDQLLRSGRDELFFHVFDDDDHHAVRLTPLQWFALNATSRLRGIEKPSTPEAWRLARGRTWQSLEDELD